VTCVVFRDQLGELRLCPRLIIVIVEQGNRLFDDRLTELIQAIETACGRKAAINLLPMQDGDVYQTAADIEDISRDLGFAPTTPISVGIPAFVVWYRDEWMKRQETDPRGA
jgi:UDP-glucuronate 4-epimerase